MNIIILFSLLCLSSSTSVLAPMENVANKSLISNAVENNDLMSVIMENKGDSANLVQLMSNVDPSQLREVLSLIQVLLAASKSDLSTLVDALATATTALTDATAAYDAAVLERIRLESDYVANRDALDGQVSSLLVTKNEATGARTNAQNTLDTESVRLNGEIATLTQVIQILEDLGTSGLARYNAGCYKIQDEAECLRSKDGRRGHLDSPCDWCCGGACTAGKTYVCEPHKWLLTQQTSYDRSKNGAGYDTCPAVWQGKFSQVYTNGHTDETTMSCSGEMVWRAKQLNVNTLQFVNADGVPHPDAKYQGWYYRAWDRVSAWEYFRFTSDGKLEVHHFCSDGCRSTSPLGSSQFCCSSLSSGSSPSSEC